MENISRLHLEFQCRQSPCCVNLLMEARKSVRAKENICRTAGPGRETERVEEWPWPMTPPQPYRMGSTPLPTAWAQTGWWARPPSPHTCIHLCPHTRYTTRPGYIISHTSCRPQEQCLRQEWTTPCPSNRPPWWGLWRSSSATSPWAAVAPTCLQTHLCRGHTSLSTPKCLPPTSQLRKVPSNHRLPSRLPQNTQPTLTSTSEEIFLWSRGDSQSAETRRSDRSYGTRHPGRTRTVTQKGQTKKRFSTNSYFKVNSVPPTTQAGGWQAMSSGRTEQGASILITVKRNKSHRRMF